MAMSSSVKYIHYVKFLGRLLVCHYSCLTRITLIFNYYATIFSTVQNVIYILLYIAQQVHRTQYSLRSLQAMYRIMHKYIACPNDI